MNPRRKKRLLAVVAIIFGVGATIGLVLYALQENINLFYTPSELVEGKGPNKEKPHIGQKLRIGPHFLNNFRKKHKKGSDDN